MPVITLYFNVYSILQHSQHTLCNAEGREGPCCCPSLKALLLLTLATAPLPYVAPGPPFSNRFSGAGAATACVTMLLRRPLPEQLLALVDDAE
jgi:hypothetical protein